MKLRITSPDGHKLQVEDAETGAILQGVKSVKWDSDWIGKPRVELQLSNVAIDMAVDANRVNAYGFEDNKSARMPLVDVARLRWLRRA